MKMQDIKWGEKGRIHIEANYSQSIILPKILSIFKSVNEI